MTEGRQKYMTHVFLPNAVNQ